MTEQERQTCAKLYYLYSGGDTIDSHKWNNSGAQELYRMILNVQNCSMGIAWLPTIPNTMPTTPGQAAIYLVQYFYESLEKYDQIKFGKGAIEACQTSHFKSHESLIKSALIGY
jgi:hypothetical protein